MMRSMYTAASGMEAQEFRLDTLSNNLANANTAGFKRSRAEFSEVLSESLQGGVTVGADGVATPTLLQVGHGVRVTGTSRSLTQGDMLTTQNPLDVAIEGAGFFPVQRANGQLAFTRAGNFRLDSAGRLVTQTGEPLDPPLAVPQDATRINIDRNGEVTADVPGRNQPVVVGTLELAVFPNPGALESLGHNLVVPTLASGEAQRARPGELGAGALLQGTLEGSNVKAVEEMVEMISTQRAYELNSKVVQTADQMLQRLTTLR